MTLPSAAFTASLADRYEIDGPLGSGGMATVYLARDRKHDRTVALKVLHDDLAATLGPERFKREIRIAARLQHPHILSVFDSGEADGRLWYTMPFVKGESLRDRLRRSGTLPLDEALGIIREAAQALSYAHGEGVIHRDIKPENILLTRDGSTLVADFGIARASSDPAAGPATGTGLTRSGQVIGTPTYMAPEQATGEPDIDARVDQYALGAVLYELLTGAPPFTGDNVGALLAARFSRDATPVSARRSDVPPAIDAAVQKALALNAGDRFATIEEFAQAVRPTIVTGSNGSSDARASGTGTGAGRRTRLMLGATLGAVLVGGLLYRVTAKPAAPSGPARLVVLPFENLGDSADAGFVRAMTGEIRGRLSRVPGVQVIAGASSASYAKTTKTPQQIASELGVRYVLMGSVRREQRGGQRDMVHLMPELVEIGRDGAALSRWQQSYDVPDSALLGVHATVASEVATVLRGTIDSATVRRIKKPPTQNTEAYAAYLRAVGSQDERPAALRSRIAELEHAATLDSNFAGAWAWMALLRSRLYSGSGKTPAAAAEIKHDAERALATDHESVVGHQAMSIYYKNVLHDLDKALQEDERAYALEPESPDVNSNLGGTYLALGQHQKALPLLEFAIRSDPVDASARAKLGTAYDLLRRYDDAAVAYSGAVAVAPASQRMNLFLVASHIRRGDSVSARRAVNAAYEHMQPVAFDSYLARYGDYAWLLDSAAKRRVLSTLPAAFDGDTAQHAFIRAQILFLQGDTSGSRAEAARALPYFAQTLTRAVADAEIPLMYAWSAAIAGHAPEARRLLARSRQLEDSTRENALNREYFAYTRAQVATVLGEPDTALTELENLLRNSRRFTRGHLILNPWFAPLRSLPRFQRLLSMEPVAVEK